MFGEERQIRLCPSYFPFTEPSVEVDVSLQVWGEMAVTYVRKLVDRDYGCRYGSPSCP